jgi:uncharacterized protein YkwD
MILGIAGILLLTPIIAISATTPETPAVARTKAWDGINQTLGGVPESVRKIEYRGSIFYLAPNVTDDDFTAVIAAGPEAVRMKPTKAQNTDRLYNYPAYILWNAGKTALLVHPIIFSYDDILEAVATPADPPAGLTGAQTAKEAPKAALSEEQEYILSDEYADALRNEFYRLLNEYRAANGLRALGTSPELQGYADIRASELRERPGHTRPDGSPSGSGWRGGRIDTWYAENALSTGAIGRDPISVASFVFSRWQRSPGHDRHLLYDFGPNTKMALGIDPKLEENGFVTSGFIFATGD